MIKSISDFQNVFFIGVAGVGMSAIAQYLKGIGKEVSGSDRYFKPDEYNKTKEQLEKFGVTSLKSNLSSSLSCANSSFSRVSALNRTNIEAQRKTCPDLDKLLC